MSNQIGQITFTETEDGFTVDAWLARDLSHESLVVPVQPSVDGEAHAQPAGGRFELSSAL